MIFHSLCLFCVGGAVFLSEGHPGPTSALTNQTFRCLDATVRAALLRLLGSPGLGEVRARSPLLDPAKDLAPPHTDAIIVKQLKLKQRTQFAGVDRNHGYGCVLLCGSTHRGREPASMSPDIQVPWTLKEHVFRTGIRVVLIFLLVFQRGERPS